MGEGDAVVAALDLGSNSFHLVVMQVSPDRSLHAIAAQKEVLGLGEIVTRLGRFDEPTVARILDTVCEFVRIAERAGAETIVANATSAFREADNTAEVIDEIQRRCGLRVRVISGHEEAELIFLALRAACHLGSLPVVGADLGGGSLELTCGDQTQLFFGQSLALGVGRLQVRFGAASRHDEGFNSIKDYVKSQLVAPVAAILGYRPTRLILTSGTFFALGRLAAARTADRDPLEDAVLARRFTREALSKAINEVERTPPSDRSQLPGIDSRRAETVGVGAVVLSSLLDTFDLDEIWLCRWALREGMVLRALEEENFSFSYPTTTIRRGSVEYLLDKYRVHRAHADKVRELAVSLFDQLGSIHHLEPGARELCETAALLHDIGRFISEDHHDRHGAYLINSAPPKGFSRRELLTVEAVIAGHAKGDVDLPDALSGDLGAKETVSWLVALVRVADALDRSHQQVVRGVRWHGPRRLIVDSVGDIALERLALIKKQRLLEVLVGGPITVYVGDQLGSEDESGLG
ncbi:MAG: Ppx/GppA phosphatase family protein [Ferrimicrobium sp.]